MCDYSLTNTVLPLPQKVTHIPKLMPVQSKLVVRMGHVWPIEYSWLE